MPSQESNYVSPDKDRDVTYESVGDALIAQFAELTAPYEDMLKWWGAEKPGPHVVFGELLNPFVDRLVEHRLLARAFEFIERLSCSKDARVRDLVATTICAHVVSNPQTLRRSQMLMGNSTRKQCQE